MSGNFSRRNLFQVAGAAAGAMLGGRLATAQQPQPAVQPAKPCASRRATPIRFRPWRRVRPSP